MGFWQHTPPGVDARLVELAHLFADCREAFFETADRFHWTPAPGSTAAHAATDLPSPDPAVPEPTGGSLRVPRTKTAGPLRSQDTGLRTGILRTDTFTGGPQE